MPLQIRRGTDAERLAMTQPLAAGELLYVTDTQRIYVGNNSTLGGVAVTGYTDNDAKDAAAQIFTGGSHTGINFTYNTVSNLISASLDLSNYQGIVNVNAVKGSVFADDSSLLVDAVDNRVFASNGFFGNLTGNVTGNVTGNLVGNVTGNIFTNLIDSADSSAINVTPTMVFNSDVIVENEIIGNLVGNVSGDITGDVRASNGQLIIDNTTRQINVAALNLDANGLIGSPNGITILPTSTLSILKDSGDIGIPGVLFQTNASADIYTSALGLARGRGSALSPTACNVNDEIAKVVGYPFDGVNYFPSAALVYLVDGAISPNVVPSRMEMVVTNTSGTPITALVLRGNSASFAVPPKLPVVANDASRTSLIAAPSAGMLIFMQSGTAPAATNVVQVFDGTSWVNLH